MRTTRTTRTTAIRTTRATTATLKSSQASTIHHAAGHVFAMTRITLHHHGGWFKDRHGDLCHGQLLMVCLLRRDNWSIGGEHEVNPGIRHEICLEFGDVHVQRTIKAQRSCPWSARLAERLTCSNAKKGPGNSVKSFFCKAGRAGLDCGGKEICFGQSNDDLQEFTRGI